jgi:hypothetical protein
VKQRLLSTGAVLFLLTRAAAAAAGGDAPTVEEIKAAEGDFNRGREAYKAGSYSEAAEYFESADAHAPNDKVIELAIRAREKSGPENLDRAATLAGLALERYPTNDAIKKLAAPLIERAKPQLLAVTIECNEPCSLLDGTRIVHGAPATRRVVYLNPGDHTIRAAWSDDRTDSKNVSGKAGESAALQFMAPPMPKKEEAPPPPAPTTNTGANPMADQGKPSEAKPFSPIVFWSGLGATVLLGGITTWSGIDTINNPGKDKVRSHCNPTPQPDCQSLYDQGRSAQTRTNVLIGATSVVGVATAVIGAFFTDWGGGKEGAAASTAKVSPFVGYQNGPALGAVGRF